MAKEMDMVLSELIDKNNISSMWFISDRPLQGNTN